MSDYENIRLSFFLPVHRVAGRHMAYVLQENAEFLESQGVIIPDPDKARIATFTAIQEIDMKKPVAAIQKKFFKTLLEDKSGVERIIVVAQNLMGNVMRPFGPAGFFPITSGRIGDLEKIFGALAPDYYFTTRHPLSFITSLYVESLLDGNRGSIDEFLAMADLNAIRWSSTFDELSERLGMGEVNLFRYEDYPEIALPVVQHMAGLDSVEGLKIDKKPSKPGLSSEGAYIMWERLNAQLDEDEETPLDIHEDIRSTYPSLPPEQDTFLLPKEAVETLSDRYEDDLYYISKLDNVNLIKAP